MLRTLVDNSVLSAAEEIRSQGPHSQILTGEGGGQSDRGSYFVPQKIATSEFVYPKNHYFF